MAKQYMLNAIREYYKELLIDVRMAAEENNTEDGLSLDELNTIIDRAMAASLSEANKVLDFSTPATTQARVQLKETFVGNPTAFKKRLTEFSYRVAKAFPDNLLCARISNNLNPNTGMWYELGRDLNIGKVLNYVNFDAIQNRRAIYNRLPIRELLYIDFDIKNLSAEEKNELVSFLLVKKEQILSKEVEQTTIRYNREYVKRFVDMAEIVPHTIGEKALARINELLGDFQTTKEI